MYFSIICVTVQHALVKPSVKGLEDDDTGPPPEEPAGLDYSSAWRNLYLSHRDEIEQNLHILHPSLQTVLQMGQQVLGQLLLVDCSAFRQQGAMEFEHLRNNVILECEKMEERLLSRYGYYG